MRLPWRKTRDCIDSEATCARLKAERDLAATRAETPKYRELAESLREIRERNHFGEAIAHSFRGRTS